MSELLNKIDGPADLKTVDPAMLPALAEEIRALIISTVSNTGGHLAANLGTVELTIALLKVFDPAVDRIVWDVSHQAYSYKILTGRRDRIHTLRQTDGISGFLSRRESEFDVFGAGHAGTALSASLGMAVARDRRGSSEHVVAVVGDASLGCGSSFEALNNIASATKHMILVLNDNEMSISANVGAISKYLGKLLADLRYNKWKSSVEKFARNKLHLGSLARAYYKMEESVKGLFLGSVVFEEFGLRYIGPIDGHDVRGLIEAFLIAADSDEPIIIHVSTQKGKGYLPAETNPESWHGTTPFESSTGKRVAGSDAPTYSKVFGDTLAGIAEHNDRVVAITAAMRSGTGLTGFAERFPRRFFDVGISEEHAVVFGAGLAAEGFSPVVALYSTFSQRVVDYIIHDVCLQELPVVFCLDRAGVVGDDGPTHHGVFDLALLRAVPNLAIMQPGNEAEMSAMLHCAIELKKPVVIRYPRGVGPGVPVPDEPLPVPFGKAEVVKQGRSVWIWALGDMLQLGEAVCGELEKSGVSAGLVNTRFVKPLDEQLLADHAGSAEIIVSLENGVVDGGLGSAICERLASMNYNGRFRRFGWPDEFVPHGANDKLMERFGLTPGSISSAILQLAGK